MATRKPKRKKAQPSSRGLGARELAAAADGGDAGAQVDELRTKIEDAGGAVIGAFRDPLGGNWLALAALPIDAVAPTPFQRELSESHVKRLAEAVEQVGFFLGPIIAVPTDRAHDGVRFWTPNGYHRFSALKLMGAKSITALVSVDEKLAYRILALNTEKAHNVKERCLEAVRMARGLAEIDPKVKETAYGIELQDASLVTLGFAYEERPRFAGGAYAPALKASEAFLDQPIGKALETRQERAARILKIDDRVGQIIDALKQRGFESPYLRNFVVARVRPFRPPGKDAPDVDSLLDHMETAAAKFNLERVKKDDLAKTAGSSED
jgi:ParB family chromosome partitioning protein